MPRGGGPMKADDNCIPASVRGVTFLGAGIRLPADIPEWLSPIVSVVPGQMWARSLAIGKGLDPDRPRGLSKVTLTR